MKNKKTTLLLVALSLVFSLFVTSCDVKNPIEGVKLRVNSMPRTTVVNFSVYDAATSQLINDEVTITFKGVDRSKVISMTNTELSYITTKEGIINFAISETGKIPSRQDPVNVTAVVSVNGYVSSSTQLRITSPGISSYSIELASYTSPPKGVESHETVGKSTASGVEKDIVAKSKNGSGSKAEVTIKKGTILKNSAGTVLTGEVKTRVTYFDPQEEQSLNSFPGGFSVDIDGQPKTFISAGFVAIDMKVGNDKVEVFDKSKVTVDLDVTDVKKENGSLVGAGDEIPLWSYNEDTGEWKSEGTIVVAASLAKSASGKTMLRATTKIAHLSYWNLDWYGNACSEGITIRFTGNCVNQLRIKGKRISDGRYFYSGYLSGSDMNVTLLRAPRNTPSLIELWDYTVYPYVKVGEKEIDNLCGDDVEFPIDYDTGITEITLTGSVACYDDDETTVTSRFYPNSNAIWARKSLNEVPFGNWMNLGQIVEGELSACLEIGHEYLFATYINGWVYKYATPTQASYDIEFSNITKEYKNPDSKWDEYRTVIDGICP